MTLYIEPFFLHDDLVYRQIWNEKWVWRGLKIVVSLLSMANCSSESVIIGSPMTNSDCVKFSIGNNYSKIFSEYEFSKLNILWSTRGWRRRPPMLYWGSPWPHCQEDDVVKMDVVWVWWGHQRRRRWLEGSGLEPPVAVPGAITISWCSHYVYMPSLVAHHFFIKKDKRQDRTW